MEVSKLVSEWYLYLENLARFILGSALLLAAWSSLQNREIISALPTLKIKQILHMKSPYKLYDIL